MISALIPAYNEAATIAATIVAARALAGEIIVVDDGSEDDTAARAEAAGAEAVFRQPHQGKGAALQAAFGLSRGEVLLLLDADLGESAAEASKLLAPVLSGAADMTIATFPAGAGSGGGFGFAVRLACWGIRRLTGRTMEAPLSGQRALRSEVALDAGGFAPGWGAEVALTVSALRAGCRVLEIPTSMTHRVTGRSPAAVRHRAAQFFAIALTLLRLWRDRGHSALPPAFLAERPSPSPAPKEPP
ncbi:MAG TPA: glycosyltransferase [Chthonomonadaceae bacterium]|nr:glycosyltransferase [Chthonomonadaceae bacterium]